MKLLIFGLALCVVPLARAETSDEAEIQRWLHQHAQREKRVEVPASRHRVVGDLHGERRADVALLYTLKPRAAQRGESRSGYYRYLATFKRARDGQLRYYAHVLVSGPGAGEANRATILNRTVVVEMLSFKAGDAPCCPTQATTRRYRLTAHGLALTR